MIKAIFCDFYGTVVHEDDEPICAITERIYQSGNAKSTKEIGIFWWQCFSELCTKAYGENFRSQRELELQSLQNTLDYFNASANAEELSRPQFEYWTKPPIFQDTKSFFDKCPVPIYIVSNIDTADLTAALDFHDLIPTGYMTSEKARSYKPNKEIFSLALRKFKLSSNEVIHIGDSVTSDVLGARAAGITSVWINRKGRIIPQEVEHWQPDLISVVNWLMKWEGRE